MEAKYSTAEIWRMRRIGEELVLEVHSQELDRWIEMRFARPNAFTFIEEFNRLLNE